ncbi:uncharacterized protein N7458_008737, partial [Penicillium daleae]
MLLQFRPSQIGSSENHPLRYTTSLMNLLWDDFLLGFRCFRYAPRILLPLRLSRLSSRNELRGTRENLIILYLIERDFTYLVEDGELVIDWLLDEVPHNLLNQLEVYTFTSAANHFNNLYTRASALRSANSRGELALRSKVIRYIEHYTNSRDF